MDKYQKYRESHREQRREYNRKWRERNAGYRSKNRLDTVRRYYRAHRVECAERTELYRLKNLPKYAAYKRNRLGRKHGAGGSHTAADIQDIGRMQRHRCAYCAIPLRRAVSHADHIQSVRRGGSSYRRNMQLLCAPCNQSKSDRDPIEFARSLGRLL